MARFNRQLINSIKQTAKERVDRSTAVIRNNLVETLERGDGVSGPGESPISKSGELAASMQNYPAVDRGSLIEGAAGTNLYRHLFMERGTSSMAPRPLLFPVLMRSRDRVMRIMVGEDQGDV